LVVSTSAIDCLETLTSEIDLLCVERDFKLHLFSHSLTPMRNFESNLLMASMICITVIWQ